MSENVVKPVYVLHGGDAFLLDRERRRIVDRAVGQADPQTCVSVFDGDAELATVLDELRTLPFLAPRRVVIVRDADGFVTTNRKALEEYVAAPAASGTLVLMVGVWRASKLAKAVEQIGETINCSTPERSASLGFIRDAAERRGKRIARDAQELLAELTGGDLSAIDAEVEKLSLYVGERKTISCEDVAALVTSAAGPEAFALTNAITAGDPAAALEALERMLTTRGEEFRVLGMIAWHLRRVLQAREMIDRGARSDELFRKVRMPRPQQQAFAEMLRRRPTRTVRRDFRRLIHADLAMKSGVAPPAAMQELVIQLCS